MKQIVRELLEQGRFEEIAALAPRKRRVLGILVSLTFAPDPQLGWRAVEAMGLAASAIAQDDPEFVRNHLRRLYWLLSEESGGVCWQAPQCMAEIVCHRPQLFGEFVPIVVSLLLSMAEEDLEHFRAGILWAIGRLGPLATDHLQAVLPAITAALDHCDPQVRGLAVWCLAGVGQAKLLLPEHLPLLTDEGAVDLYEGGVVRRTHVGELARRASGSRSTDP
jgi:hypothetical protein